MSFQLNRREFINHTAAFAMGTGAAMMGNQIAQSAESEKSTPFKTKLKKGLELGMLPGKLSLEDRMQMAKDLGYDGVEASTTDDPKAVEQIKNAAAKAGIEIHSVMNMAHWDCPMSSDKPEVVEKSLKGMETSLRNAKAWGASAVLLVPAVVNEHTMYRDAYTRSQTNIRKLLPLAEELKIIIALENVWNKFLLSPIEFARYVDEFNSPFVQAYFDVGNIMLYGFPQDWIRTLGPRIKKFHVKGWDAKKKGGLFDMFTDHLAGGTIPWQEVRQAIEEIGYNGYINAELGSGDEKYLRQISEEMDAIIAGK